MLDKRCCHEAQRLKKRQKVDDKRGSRRQHAAKRAGRPGRHERKGGTLRSARKNACCCRQNDEGQHEHQAKQEPGKGVVPSEVKHAHAAHSCDHGIGKERAEIAVGKKIEGKSQGHDEEAGG